MIALSKSDTLKVIYLIYLGAIPSLEPASAEDLGQFSSQRSNFRSVQGD
jgi:hypothetical protein